MEGRKERTEERTEERMEERRREGKVGRQEMRKERMFETDDSKDTWIDRQKTPTAIASKDLVIIAISILIATITVMSWNKANSVLPVRDVIPNTLL